MLNYCPSISVEKYACRSPSHTAAGWEEYLDEDGDVFYYESSRDKSTYEHPCDAYFKWMYLALKQQRTVRQSTLALPCTSHN